MSSNCHQLFGDPEEHTVSVSSHDREQESKMVVGQCNSEAFEIFLLLVSDNG